MNLQDLFEKKTIETWTIEEGCYTGRVTECKMVKEKTKLLIKIKLESGTIFMNCPCNSEINAKIFDPFMKKYSSLSQIIGTEVDFEVKNNGAFTNIIRISEKAKKDDDIHTKNVCNLEEIIGISDEESDVITF